MRGNARGADSGLDDKFLFFPPSVASLTPAEISEPLSHTRWLTHQQQTHRSDGSGGYQARLGSDRRRAVSPLCISHSKKR